MSLLSIIISFLFIFPCIFTEETTVLKLIHYAPPHPNITLLSTQRVTLYLESSFFAAFVDVGQDHVGQLLMMDSGTPLSWIKCKRRKGVRATYNPANSPSSTPLLCSDFRCISEWSTHLRCNPDRYHCGFGVGYGGQEQDTAVFGSVIMEDIFLGFIKNRYVLGCAFYYQGIPWGLDGILGIGPGESSIVVQQGSSRFAYCIGNLLDPGYIQSRLLIGNTVAMLGIQTPITVINERYHVNLTSISYDNRLLDIDPQVFRFDEDDGTGGVIFDSGTQLTYLPKIVMDTIESKIVTSLEYSSKHLRVRYHGPGTWYKNKVKLLCYWGRFDSLVGFPNITLAFEGGATMQLQPHHYLLQDRVPHGLEYFCVTMLPYDAGLPVSIIGALAQRDTYVAYDLARSSMSFERMDCIRLTNN